MDGLTLSVVRSCARLMLLIGRFRGPREMIDLEAEMLVGRIALLVGPDKARAWIDRAVDATLAQLSEPTGS